MTSSDIRIQGLKAEIAVHTRGYVSANKLSTKDQATAQTELNSKLYELHSAEVSAANAAGRAGAAAAKAAAKQTYDDFVANEKLKVTEADKSVQAIIAIYEDWKDKAANIYHQSADVMTNIARQEAQAINTARASELKESERQESQRRIILSQCSTQSMARYVQNQGQKGDTAEADIGWSQIRRRGRDNSHHGHKQVADWQRIADAADAGSQTQKDCSEAVNSIILQANSRGRAI
jgi:hypothetical protein